MKSMRDFFGSLIGAGEQPQHEERRTAPVLYDSSRQKAEELFRKGDIIGGMLEVYGTLGKGGFGVVYLVYDREMKSVYALKTFKDELLGNSAAREVFRKEAVLWLNLEDHPFILAAAWVREFSGRLFVAMEHVAPDAHGRVSLADHLARARGPLDTGETLKWAVEFCIGMEHALSHGIKCHRDIKPANILITQDGMLKISDFGLATAAETAWRISSSHGGSFITRGSEGVFGMSVMQTGGRAHCGTPGYMPPEVYRGDGTDIRSDIYSFGLVLWQMATGSRVPPFFAQHSEDLERCLFETYEQQMIGRVPQVDGPLRPVIERCVKSNPAERYGSFAALREVLEHKIGMKIEVSRTGEETASFWNNKGASFSTLGRYEESIDCYERALAIDPQHPAAWNNRGYSLYRLGRPGEAIPCHDQALALDPQNALAWSNKGIALAALGQQDEAIECYDQAIALDPRDALPWYNKGNMFKKHGRYEEAIGCYENALAIDPRDAHAWHNKGTALTPVGRCKEAISCFDQALVIDPLRANSWYCKASTQDAVGQRREAAISYLKFIECAPPEHAQFVMRVRQRLAELQKPQ